MNEDLLQRITCLIKELRNSRDIETNWAEMKQLIESNTEAINKQFSSRWLISICDTYADFGDDIEKRNAFILSLFINMIRVSDTILYLYKGKMNSRRIKELKSKQIPLYDGLVTLHLDRQDTCLNLSKRMIRLLQKTPQLYAIYQTLIARAMTSKNLLTEFAAVSEMPERMFPLNALEMPDNYGII